MVLLLLVLGGAGWGVSDRIEQDNDFCNACHLPGGTPLHIETREDFDRVIPIDLAGVHGRGWVEEREDSAFRCIDCHSGSGMVERVKVKFFAARDGVRWLAGDFEEPKGMPFDLSAEACLSCHTSFRQSAAPGWTVEAFHGRADHQGPEVPRCVRCHAVHEKDGDGIRYFMSRARVDRICRECHEPDTKMAIPSLVIGQPAVR
jgi:hypothetical protein